MSSLACDVHGSRSDGRLYGLYTALLVDNERYSRYQRVCPDCMATLMHAHSTDWSPRVPFRDHPEQKACSNCGVVVDREALLHRFYATAYVKQNTRVDYSALYCADCSDMLKNELRLEVSNGHR